MENTCKQFDKICEILANYAPEDHKIFHETVDKLCGKGIANGCFQNYGVLSDVLNILNECEIIIKNSKGTPQ